MSSTRPESPTLGPSDTLDLSSAEESLISVSRRRQQVLYQGPRTSLDLSGRASRGASECTTSGDQFRTDSNGRSRASVWSGDLEARRFTASPNSGLVPFLFTMQPGTVSSNTSMTSTMLNQSTLHVSLSINTARSRFGFFRARI